MNRAGHDLRRRSGPLLLLAAALVVSSAAGCKRQRPRKLLPAALRLAPVDSAAEGELSAGEVSAFGFVLPRGMRVTARMEDTVYARGQLGFEAAKRYLRDQLVDARAEETPHRLLLTEAKLAHRPADTLRLSLSQTGNGVELVIRVRHRQAAEAGLSEAERWKRAGLTPDGQVIENLAQ